MKWMAVVNTGNDIFYIMVVREALLSVDKFFYFSVNFWIAGTLQDTNLKKKHSEFHSSFQFTV